MRVNNFDLEQIVGEALESLYTSKQSTHKDTERKFGFTASSNPLHHYGNEFSYIKSLLKNSDKPYTPQVPAMDVMMNRLLARIVDEELIPQIAKAIESTSRSCWTQVVMEDNIYNINGIADLLIEETDGSLSVYDVKLESMCVEGSITHNFHLAQVWLYSKALQGAGYTVKDVGLIRLSKVPDTGYITPHKTAVFIDALDGRIDETDSLDKSFEKAVETYKEIQQKYYNRRPTIDVETYSVNELDNTLIHNTNITFLQKLTSLNETLKIVLSERQDKKKFTFVMKKPAI